MCSVNCSYADEKPIKLQRETGVVQLQETLPWYEHLQLEMDISAANDRNEIREQKHSIPLDGTAEPFRFATAVQTDPRHHADGQRRVGTTVRVAPAGT